MNTTRNLVLATVLFLTAGAVAIPIADASSTGKHQTQYFTVANSSNPSSGFQAAMKQASNPRLTNRTNVKPHIGPAAAAAVVARAAAPAVGRFAAKWAKRGFMAAGGAAAVSAGAEAGKDFYNAAKSLGQKVIGIWS